MSQCSFTSTTYVPEATTAVEGVTVSATQPVAATGTGPGTSATSPGSSAAISSYGAGSYRYGLAVGAVLSVVVTWF